MVESPINTTGLRLGLIKKKRIVEVPQTRLFSFLKGKSHKINNWNNIQYAI